MNGYIEIDKEKLGLNSIRRYDKRRYEAIVNIINLYFKTHPEVLLGSEDVKKCRACNNHFHKELEKLCGQHCPECDAEARFNSKIDLNALEFGNLEDFADA